ncbi:MAG: hypothetical protein HC852_15405 [Acaryochloridaceae cyanobacterium RU_4_10]|nr:hypothetical protein [Acaryochloridaceae cyanobacterium RU_4_10]
MLESENWSCIVGRRTTALIHADRMTLFRHSAKASDVQGFQHNKPYGGASVDAEVRTAAFLTVVSVKSLRLLTGLLSNQ